MSKLKKTYLIILSLLCIAGAAALWGYYSLFSEFSRSAATEIIYIDSDDTADSVFSKLHAVARPHSLNTFRLLASHYGYGEKIRTGRYAIEPGKNIVEVFRQLRNGAQQPVRITVGEARTTGRLAATLAAQIMADSASMAKAMSDSALSASLGYDSCTLMAMFVPDTYEVYWNISPEQLLKRLAREHDNFWNAKGRKEKAAAQGLKPNEVCTLASIVDEETNNSEEKPIVAGLYLNRLRRGMLLQADPTVKYALGDFTLRRILNRHLDVESPYNTYKYPGLPPGPIRMASVKGIDAVLNAASHNYIYMCAKEDFSGTHNFATTLSEHQRNAARYAHALNARGIK